MYSVSWETTLRDSSASARQRPPRASVCLVLAVFGPPSAHGCYHNAVHVEPGLPQGCCVGLAQTTLQHVEKGLTHSLKKPKTNKHTGIKQCFFFLIYIYIYEKQMCKCLTSCNMWLIRQTTAGWLPLPDAFAPGWAKSPPGSEGRPGGWLQHRSRASPGITDRCSAQIANGLTAASAELTLVTCSRNSGLEMQSCVEPQFVV